MHEPCPAVVSSAIFVFAEVRARMQHQKWQFKLIRTGKFFGEGANRIRMKLRISRSEVDEIIGVPEHRQQFAPLDMIEESSNLLPPQRPGKPLHVIFHEDLHGSAVDRT